MTAAGAALPLLSLTFLAYALVHLSIWIWGWRAWARNGRPVALLLVLVSGTLLWYDNFRIGIGRFVGEGATLKAMTAPAFAWHWTMLPLLVIAAGSIARLAGLRWARRRAVMALFCLAAIAMMAHDLPKIFSLELHPACIADTFRYSTRVSELQRCTPDAQAVQGAGAALVAILTNVIVLGVGIALWIARGWPWLAAGAAAMFVAAGAFARSYWALPIANFGEILITAALIASAVHFARLQAAPRSSG